MTEQRISDETPQRWRKRPVVIEAMRYVGNNCRALCEWSGHPHAKGDEPGRCGVLSLFIQTLEGEMECRPGDWLIKGVRGEFYPCKPDIFAATYEPADGPPASDYAQHQEAVDLYTEAFRPPGASPYAPGPRPDDFLKLIVARDEVRLALAEAQRRLAESDRQCNDAHELLQRTSDSLAEAHRERDSAIGRCDELELAVHEYLPQVTTDADGNLESDEVCRIETVGLLYSEAQRENERLKAAVVERDKWLALRPADIERLGKREDALEQHVAALRDALEQAADAMDAARGDSRITGASITARAILTNTAAGSAAWLAAHDAETKAPLLQTIENERAQFQRETLRTSECYRLIREMAEVIENTPDAHAHEPDAAAARIGRPGECPRCRLVADARALLAHPLNDTGSAEKDAQIAALVAALAEASACVRAHIDAQPPGPTTGLRCPAPMWMRATWDRLLANLPAAAAAYTADVRRAALEEAISLVEDGHFLHGEAPDARFARAVVAMLRRALAAQPEQK